MTTADAEELSLMAFARKAYAESASLEDAKALLIREISGDERLFNEIVNHAADQLVRQAQHCVRSAIMGRAQSAGASPKTYSRDMQNRVASAFGRFLEWPLMDGTRLGLADREHLLRDAYRHRINATGNLRNAVFYEAVARRLREGQRVADVLDDAHLSKLMRQAQKTVNDEA